MRIRTIATLLAAASAALPATAAADWREPIGGPSPLNESPNSHGRSARMALVAGIPYVAWCEDTQAGSSLQVARLEGDSSWARLQGVAHQAPPGTFDDPEIAVAGSPFVAYEDITPALTAVRVARLEADGSWQMLPPVHGEQRDSIDPSLATIDGVLHAAWSGVDSNGEFGIYVARLVGGNWELLAPGTVNTGSTSAFEPSLASIDGVPHVAYIDHDGTNWELRVSRFDQGVWSEFISGPSPINHDPDRDANLPSLAEIDGAAHVAWSESDGRSVKLRVARQGSATWQELGSGVNHASGNDAMRASLADFGGDPMVAWEESSGSSWQVRVARFDGRGWAAIGDVLNVDARRNAHAPSLVSRGGVPYMAFDEEGDASIDVRVKRLEPEFVESTAVASATEALLVTRVRTDGVPFEVGFRYGPSLTNVTATTRTAGVEDTIVRRVGSLEPAAVQQMRPFGLLGTPATAAVGDVVEFTTQPVSGPGATGATGSPGASGDPGPRGDAGPSGPRSSNDQRMLVALLRDPITVRSGRRAVIDYVATADGAVAIEIKRRGKPVARLTQTATAGRNRIAWRARGARPGSYSLELTATGGNGQNARDRAALKVTRRPAGSRPTRTGR